MLKKPYGNTGKDISVVGFGGMRFEAPNETDRMADVVLHAHQKGITYFDTAPGYCGQKSEVIFGRAFEQIPRDSYYVSTKSNKPDGDDLWTDLETSLERMKIDCIDFFHIWWVLSKEAWEGRKAGGAVAAALKAKEEGLVKHVVMSSHMSGDELKDVLAEEVVEGVTLGYCAINFPLRQSAVDAAAEMGMGVVTMNPLGGGIIPQNAERFAFLKGPGDRSVVEAAIRFNVSQPNVTCALVGFSNAEQVDEACAAVTDFQPYGPEHVRKIEQKLLDSFDDLCTGCGYCLPCPEGVPIPKLMDVYNQKILGAEDQMGGRLKWHWGMGPEAAGVCTMCGACEKKCTQHLPIRERLKEVAKVDMP
ncbi:MAG: aldo/keto reductase [Planctomycetota bacterium]